MKWCILILSIFAANVAAAKDQAGSFAIVLEPPDKRALRIVTAVLSKEIAEAQQSDSAPAPTILTSWASLSVAEPPYLFVELVDHYHCGNVNCELWGFQHSKTGWRRVFSGSGEKWNVLATSQNGHRDLSKTMHGSALELETTVYRWVGDRYWRVSK
jgi:hypothetical protein